MNKLERITWFIIMIDVLISIYLVYSSYTQTAYCLFDGDCNSVQNSIYGTIFGIKLSWFGLFSFLTLLVVFIIEKKKPTARMRNVFFTLTIVGSIFAAYFILIQLFVLKQICTFCIVIDSIMILILILTIIHRRKSSFS